MIAWPCSADDDTSWKTTVRKCYCVHGYQLLDVLDCLVVGCCEAFALEFGVAGFYSVEHEGLPDEGFLAALIEGESFQFHLHAAP